MQSNDARAYLARPAVPVAVAVASPARSPAHSPLKNGMEKVRAYLDTYLDSTEFFACRSKAFPATQRNYWGGLESDPVTLYANGMDGGEDWMYMIVVVPTVDDKVQIPFRFLSDLVVPWKRVPCISAVVGWGKNRSVIVRKSSIIC